MSITFYGSVSVKDTKACIPANMHNFIKVKALELLPVLAKFHTEL
jgi:hypothetical protein